MVRLIEFYIQFSALELNRFNSKDGAIDSAYQFLCLNLLLRCFNSKDGAIDSQSVTAHLKKRYFGFNSKDGAIDSNVNDRNNLTNEVSIPKMVRLIGRMVLRSPANDTYVSIPKMVRLIVFFAARPSGCLPCFNSKDGAIDRASRNLIRPFSTLVSIPKMVRLIEAQVY